MTTRTASSPSSSIESNPPDSKGRFIRRLFDRISPRYDLFNRLSSFCLDRPWRRRTIQGLKLLPEMRLLDLCSGTGDLAIQAAVEMLPLGRVVACDFSERMLRSARRRFGPFPPARWHIRLIQAKAESLPFGPGSFDAVTIGFALRNVTDLEATFRELHRALKPGGRIGLLEFGRPRDPFLRVGQWFWLSTGVPILGLLTTGALWPFLYLRRSIFRFMPPEEVLRRLAAAGFTGLESEPLSGGLVVLYRGVRP